jgi:UPF0271 protein
MQLELNADVGEGLPDVDAAIMPLITSANVACGLHAGDASTMSTTVGLALRYGVAIGAHAGYDDREGFGRRARELPPAQVRDLMLYQLGALDAIAQAAGARLQHVKPHGALYNQAEFDRSLAVAIVSAIRTYDPTLRLVGRSGSAMQAAAAALGHPFTAEAFADRRYRADGSLLPRSATGALLTEPADVIQQVRSLVTEGEVRADDGSRVRITFESLCLHGDTPGAPALAALVRQELESSGVAISAPQLLGIDTLPP